MTEVGRNLLPAFNSLKTGFTYSLVSMLLFTLLVFLSFASASIAIYVLLALPFVILSAWSYGLFKRQKAWKLLGKGNISLAVIVEAVAIFILLFSWVFATSIYYSTIFGIYLYYLTVFGPPALWAIYTLLEVRGLKWLRNNYAVDLRKSWVCSVTGIIVYALAFGFEWLFPLFHLHFEQTYYDISYLTGTPVEPYLFALPFLIASCIFAIKGLNAWHSDIIDSPKT